jgi:hypothetical protein
MSKGALIGVRVAQAHDEHGRERVCEPRQLRRGAGPQRALTDDRSSEAGEDRVVRAAL